MRRLVATLIALLALAAPATAGAEASAQAQRAKARVFVTNAIGGEKLVFKPRWFLLSADGAFGVNRVKWRSYGGATARATARAFVNDCDPSCAAGHVTHPAVKLTLTKIVNCDGKRIYTRLRFKLSGPLPRGFPRHAGYSMRPIGEDGKPRC